jgi:hypothetical protein
VAVSERDLPACFFSEFGSIRAWSEDEAAVKREFGRIDTTLGCYEVIKCIVQELDSTRESNLLLFASKLVVFQFDLPDATSSQGTASSNQAVESASKVYTQAMKPMMTLSFGIQDLAQKNNMQLSNKTTRSFEPSATLPPLEFKDMIDVQKVGESVLVIQAQAGPTTLTLDLKDMVSSCVVALETGLRDASQKGYRPGRARWRKLRKAAQKAFDSSQVRHGDRFAAISSVTRRTSLVKEITGVGQRVLEVWEVERYHHLSNTWRTAFQPLDGDYRWRWVNAVGKKHPQLELDKAGKKLSREEIAVGGRNPPCELGRMFKEKSAWQVVTNADTNSEGWKYGLHWNSSTWDSKPAMFDGVRKRLWTKTYE